MAYTPINDLHGVFVHNDYKAAKANYEHAKWLAQDAQHRGDTAGLAAATAAFTECRARLLEVREHVTVAGGHPALPLTP